MTTLHPTTATERAAALAPAFFERAARHDREASFPFENFEDLHEARLLNLSVPREFGGDGLGLRDGVQVIRTVASGDGSTALVLAMHYIHHATLANDHSGWDRGLYERLCRESVDGIALVNTMRVEPDLGSPSRGGIPGSTGTRTADGWLFNGHKLYSTGSPICAYHFAWGRTAGDNPMTGHFVVPREAPGWRIVETWDHLGMRATASHDTVYENVPLALENAADLRTPADWMRPDVIADAWNALCLGALYTGIAQSAARWLKQYLYDRVPSNLGAPLASLPRFQSAVGEIETMIYTSERLLDALATDLDEGRYNPNGDTRFGMGKYTATTNAIRAVDLAVSLIGNPGLTRHNPLERLYRDVLCGRVNFPQDDMVLLNSGRAALEAAKPA